MKAVRQAWFETQRFSDDLYCITEPFYCWEIRALCTGDAQLILSAPALGFVPERDFDAIPYRGFSASDYEVRACPHAQALRSAAGTSI